MIENRFQIYRNAIRKWGYDNQINQCIEEMAELIKALNKFRRNCDFRERTDTDNAFRGDVIEEIADVQQMLEQMLIVFEVTTRELEDNLERSVRKLHRELEEE